MKHKVKGCFDSFWSLQMMWILTKENWCDIYTTGGELDLRQL